MRFVVVVPGEPLGEVEVLPLDGIRGMEEHVEAPVLETVVELLDLPIVLGVVGFVSYVSDPCEGTGCGEPGPPFPSAVRANGTNDEGGMNDDVLEEGNGILLIAVFKELGDGEP